MIILAIVLLASSVACAAGPVLIEIPKQRSVKNDSVLCEIVSYSVEPPFGNAHGRPTNAHETAHGIHASYRIKHREAGRRINACYMRDGRVAIIEEPEFLISNIDVPEPLRSYRYPLYFKSQLKDWNDTPLYVLDEWTAYICGGETAVDDWYRCGIDTDEDSVSGCLEFSVYAVALYLTAKERAPEYLERDGQLKAVIGFNLGRAEAAFTAGREVFRSERQDRLYEALQKHPAASEIRWCLRDEFDGAFLEGGAK